ncbi:SubName: Full=Uncharacterized protein {ECO:0000313/EMBL:CCA76187.1} [Serendipita indica DSM 11827]|nr:SubName: Full=Uncharacterized protein {ECO:0000313/EMBL:CCA76187.1} [Serendipita indica DSM 11827]
MFKKQIIGILFLALSALGAPASDLTARQSCSSLQLVHISGTTEVGLGTVGTPLAAALASAVPGTTTHSVTYDTSAEYVVTVAAGAAITASYITAQSARCPNQRFVLSGYSKGALVVHSTTLSSSLKAKVVAILVFARAQNIASFCNTGDVFCWPGGISLAAHLAYPTDGSIGVAANFVKARA